MQTVMGVFDGGCIITPDNQKIKCTSWKRYFHEYKDKLGFFLLDTIKVQGWEEENIIKDFLPFDVKEVDEPDIQNIRTDDEEVAK